MCITLNQTLDFISFSTDDLFFCSKIQSRIPHCISLSRFLVLLWSMTIPQSLLIFHVLNSFVSAGQRFLWIVVQSVLSDVFLINRLVLCQKYHRGWSGLLTTSYLGVHDINMTLMVMLVLTTWLRFHTLITCWMIKWKFSFHSPLHNSRISSIE